MECWVRLMEERMVVDGVLERDWESREELKCCVSDRWGSEGADEMIDG